MVVMASYSWSQSGQSSSFSHSSFSHNTRAGRNSLFCQVGNIFHKNTGKFCLIPHCSSLAQSLQSRSRIAQIGLANGFLFPVWDTLSFKQNHSLFHSLRRKENDCFGGQPIPSTLLIKKHTLLDKDILVLDLISFYSCVDIVLRCQTNSIHLGASSFSI